MLDDSFNLTGGCVEEADNTRKVREYIQSQLGLAEFDTIVCEMNLEELVLSNEGDMVVPCWVEFARGIYRLGSETSGVKAIQILGAKGTEGI